MARPKKKLENIVQPTIREVGVPHALEKIFDGDQALMPTLKSVGYAKVPNTNTWVSFVLTTKGKEVLMIAVDEPNLRLIAEESAKTSFVTELMGQEL